MHNCSKELWAKFSNPKISRIPMKFVVSFPGFVHLLMWAMSQAKVREYLKIIFKKWKFEFESFFQSWIESCSSHVKNQSWIITISWLVVDMLWKISLKKYVLTKLCPWHGDFLWPHWISGGFRWHSHEYWFAALGKRVSSPQNQDLKNMFIKLISDQFLDFRKIWVYIGIFFSALSENLPRKSVRLAVLHFIVASTLYFMSVAYHQDRREIGKSGEASIV